MLSSEMANYGDFDVSESSGGSGIFGHTSCSQIGMEIPITPRQVIAANVQNYRDLTLEGQSAYYTFECDS